MEVQKVVLPYVDLETLNNTSFDPQEVTAKRPLSTYLYLSGSTNNELVNVGGQVLIKQCTRVSPVNFRFFTPGIPNINPINDKVKFILSSAPTVVLTATIPEASYISAEAALNALITQLNSLAFPAVFDLLPYQPNTFAFIYLRCTEQFKILPESSAVKYGISCLNFGPSITTFASTHLIGPSVMEYSFYVDIRSNVLTQYSKIRSLAVNKSLGQIFLRTPLSPSGFTVPVTENIAESPLVFNIKPTETINAIDISLFDMYGNPLYIPTYGNFLWQLTLAVEQ
jgi:hypothetical protein